MSSPAGSWKSLKPVVGGMQGACFGIGAGSFSSCMAVLLQMAALGND